MSLQYDRRWGQEDSWKLLSQPTYKNMYVNTHTHCPSLPSSLVPLLIEELMNWRPSRKIDKERGITQPSPRWEWSILPISSICLCRSWAALWRVFPGNNSVLLPGAVRSPHQRNSRDWLEWSSWGCWQSYFGAEVVHKNVFFLRLQCAPTPLTVLHH